MDKIKFIPVFLYAVVCYITLSAIVMLTQAGIDCSNLTNVCPNRLVVLTCKAPRLPIRWQSKSCTPKLFEDIVLHGNSVKGSQGDRDGFVATVVDIKNDFVLTSWNFFQSLLMNTTAKFDVNMRTAMTICQRTKTVLFIMNI